MIPYDEYLALKERMEELEELVLLRHAHAQDRDKPNMSLDELVAKLGLEM